MTGSEVERVLAQSSEMRQIAFGAPVSQWLIVWKDSDAGALVTFFSGKVYRKEFSPATPTSRDEARNWWYRYIGANPPF
jgi:hypothetical protein